MRFHVLGILVSFLFLAGCNGGSLVIEQNASTRQNGPWNFGTPGDFTYAGELFSTQSASNSAVLKPADFSVASVTSVDAGTHDGTSYNTASSRLELAADSGVPRELASSWTPSWSGMIGYWNFNSDLNDASSYGANFAAGAGSGVGTLLRMGAGAFNSDGSGGAVGSAANCAQFYSAPQLTVALWAYVYSKDDYDRFVEVTSSTVPDLNTRFRIAFDSSADQHVQVTVVDGTTAYLVTAPSAFPTGTWTHVAFTFDQSLLTLYVDGVAVGRSDGDYSTAAIAYAADSRLAILGSPIGYGAIDGAADELGIWSTALRASDIRTLSTHGRQIFNGLYRSQALDGFARTEWLKAGWTSTLPFGKELPGDVNNDGLPDDESASSYSEIISGLSTGLVGLWHLNEASGAAQDSSGKNNPGTHHGPVTRNLDGVFRGSVRYDSAAYTEIPDAAAFSITGDIAVQAWIRPVTNGTYPTLVSKATNGSDFSYVLNYDFTATQLRFLIGDNAGGYDFAAAAAPSPSDWHHVVGVADASWVYLYIDGVEAAKVARTVTTLGISSGLPLCLGALTSGVSNCDGNGFTGDLDEVAIWNRALSAAEVVQLYRRGANRVKFQFRTCTSSDCSDSPSWIGPDGSDTTWFSEAHNSATLASSGEATGTLGIASPILSFLEWISVVTGWEINRASGRYFQFQTWLESDDVNNLCGGTACKPNMSAVSLGGVAVIETARGLSFTTALSQFAVTETGDCQTNGTVRYQLSADDGVTYKYWDGYQWTAATGITSYVQAAGQSASSANIATLAASGKLRFRALVPTDSASCTLSNPQAQ